MSFIHFDVQTDHNLEGAVVTADSLMQQVSAQGMKAVGIANRNLLDSHALQTAAVRYDVKPIVGARLDIASQWGLSTIKVYPKTEKSRIRLCEALSEPFGIQLSELANWSEDWLLLSGSADESILMRLIDDNDLKGAKAWLEIAAQAAPDQWLIEMQRTGAAGEEARNRALLALSDALNLPIIGTNPVKYLHQDEHEAFLIGSAIRSKTTIKETQHLIDKGSQHAWLKKAEDMEAIFADLPEAIHHTKCAATICNAGFPLSKPLLPSIEDQQTDNLENNPNNPEENLKKKIEAGIQWRFGNADAITSEIRDRITHESRIIMDKGFASYFLIVDDFVRAAKDRGIAVGPGRGSGAGSLVAYVLGITDVNPLEHDLIFERFLNPEREALPDFDIDFDPMRRSEIIDYVREKYGAAHVAHLATVTTAQTKNAVKDTARVLAIPQAVAHRAAQEAEEKGLLEADAEDRGQTPADPNNAALFERSKNIKGLARQTGMHPAGVVIAPKPLHHFAPVKDNDGVKVLQLTSEIAEKAGLVKFDFLGLNTLRSLQLAEKFLLEVEGKKLDEEMDMNDPETIKMIASGETNTVFQLEEPGMQKLLKQFQPTSFDDVAAVIAMYRPGPLGAGMVSDAIKRKNGLAEIQYPHPALEPILKSTYGIMLYQEQVMRAAQDLAGYDAGEADILRKAMGKKKTEVMAEQRKKFLAGAKAKGILTTPEAERIFSIMETFAGYGFNKSHSVSYAMLTCKTAYIKQHYPHIHMAAVLSATIANRARFAPALAEAKRMGIPIQAPNINSSTEGFRPTESGEILFGLGAVRHVGPAAIQSILESRKANGSFKSLADFQARTKVNKRGCKSLIECGAMADFGDEAELMAELTGEGGTNQSAGFWDAPKKKWTAKQRREGELNALGIYLNHHPIDSYPDLIDHLDAEKIGEIEKPEGRVSVSLIGAIVNIERRPYGNYGQNNVRIMLDDGTGAIPIEIPPTFLDTHEDVLTVNQCVRIQATIRPDHRNDNLPIGRAHDITDLSHIRMETLKSVNILTTEDNDAQISAWLDSDDNEEGTTQVKLSKGRTWQVTASRAFCENAIELAGKENILFDYQNETVSNNIAPSGTTLMKTSDALRQKLLKSEKKLKEVFLGAA